MARFTYTTKDGEHVRVVDATQIIVEDAGPDEQVALLNSYASVVGCILTAYNNRIVGTDNWIV